MTEFLKIAEFFFTFIMGQKHSIGMRSQEISVEIINQIRRVIILVVVTVGALTLFCMGASHLIERILNNLDAGTFIFTSSVWVIIGFLFMCFGVLVYSTNKKVWLKMMKKDKDVKEPTGLLGNQLESVISLLLLDILKEREIKKSEKI